VIRWGERVTPLGTTDVDLPPCTKTAVEIVKDIIKRKSSSQAVLQKIQLPCG
jgi:3-oxoacyl-[acyl-carrier-protein] synthase-3